MCIFAILVHYLQDFAIIIFCRKQAILLKQTDAGNVDLDAIAVQTAQDFEDICNEELTKFKFASRLTGT